MRLLLLIVGTACNLTAVAILLARLGWSPETVISALGAWVVPLVVTWLGWVHAASLLLTGWILIVIAVLWPRRVGSSARRSEA